MEKAGRVETGPIHQATPATAKYTNFYSKSYSLLFVPKSDQSSNVKTEYVHKQNYIFPQ